MANDVKDAAYARFGKKIGEQLAEKPGRAPGIDQKEYTELNSFDFLKGFTTVQIGGLTVGMADVLSAISIGFGSNNFKALPGQKQELFKVAAERLSTALRDGVINSGEASELHQLLQHAHRKVAAETPEWDAISALLKGVDQALEAFGDQDVKRVWKSGDGRLLPKFSPE